MKFEKIAAPKGVREYLPPESQAFEWVREQLISPAKLAGYQLMELPVFEDTALFNRGVGESTDVVSKEMYTFEDRGGRSITLRPEGTAGVMRAVIESNLDRGQLPVKAWYSGQFFRAERPQAGRYRQFYQVGIEAIGVDDPALDAEVIAIADQGFKNLGLKNYRLEITSLGDAQSRAAHRVDLMKYIDALNLDEATRTRADLNPLRLFDDKRPEMKSAMENAPILMDYLSDYSRNHFEKVKEYLQDLGVAYTINKRMVRGLDYYTGTTFEFVHDDLGAQSGIGGGGRYDGLVEDLGGPATPGVGFALGIDRTLLACDSEEVFDLGSPQIDAFIVDVVDGMTALRLADELRAAGFTADRAYDGRSMKSQMKVADRSGAHVAIIIGPDEAEAGNCTVRNLMTSDQSVVVQAELITHLASIVGERNPRRNTQ
jgi:histidyl-tRNA synthetase